MSELGRYTVMIEKKTETIHSFDIKHVVIDDFRSYAKVYPPLDKFRRNQAITLRCDPFRLYNCRDQAPVDERLLGGPLFHPDLFLEIGWHRYNLFDQISTRHRAWMSIGKLVEHFSGHIASSSPFTRIIISPYLGQDGNDHRCCFGRNPPQVEAPPTRPKIDFQSDCSCGDGDSSGCEQLASS